MAWNTVMTLSVEFFNLSTGFHDHTAKVKISPWPFIATGTLTTMSVTITPGKLITELKRIITWLRHNPCPDWSKIYCSFTCEPIENKTSSHPVKWRHAGEFPELNFFWRPLVWRKPTIQFERQKQREIFHLSSMMESFI